MIRNRQFMLERSALAKGDPLPEMIRNLVGDNALRWYVGQINDDELILEATIYEGQLDQLSESVAGQYYPGKSAVLSIVPTGVGCNIGGYAGDAAPITNLLATAVDYLITNPNAVNASNFIKLDGNVVYTEGSSIDLFCQGLINLYLPYSNKVGLIIEKTDPDELDVIFNVLNTVRAVHGVDIHDYVITDRPIGSRCLQNESGAFVGTVDNPHVLFAACQDLIARGVNAIAVTTNVQDLPPDHYAMHFAGAYPNPVGGVEAIISHLVTRLYHVPAAHAPLINMKQLDLLHNVVDARGAGEMTSVSGLACILIGLQRAPQIKARPETRIADVINVNNLLAVVAPAGCMGGIPILYTQRHGVPVIAVHENHTVLDVTPAKMGLSNVVEVANYAEAAGIILALKRGISLESIKRPLATFRPVLAADSLSLPGEVIHYDKQLVR